MSDLPLKATLKAGRDYSDPWLTVDGANPDDLKFKLEGIASSGALQALIEAANLLKAANNAAPLLKGGDSGVPEPTSPQAWGQSSAQGNSTTNSPPPSGRQENRYGAQTHPEGEACHCGKVLEYGKTRTNKGQWKCPDYRWRNGDPNEHRLEWAD